MRNLRITTGPGSSLLDRVSVGWRARYGLAIGLAVVVGGICVLIEHEKSSDLLFTLGFLASLAAATFGGFGPGLLTTGLLVGLVRFVPQPHLKDIQMQNLALSGVLLSLVGGALRSTRLRAAAQLAANLKLEQQILEIGDDERRRIGHDLHDGLGQHLTGISLLSETIAQQLEAGQRPDPTNVETITRLVSEAVRITRDLAKSLSPVTLERDGLIAALEELSDTASTLFGINCVWEMDGPAPMLDHVKALHVFRIVQEAVSNSVRHGKARNVRIGLRVHRDELTVRISDDGRGLSPKTVANPGLGLRIMQYRARMLGATLAVERSDASGGTVVICTCPINGRAIGSETHVV